MRVNPIDFVFDLNKYQIIKDNGSRGIGIRNGKRLHEPEAERKKALKMQSMIAGRNYVTSHRLATPVFDRAHVRFYVAYPKGVGSADPLNFSHTIKPLIDGLTMSGLWPDDDSRHLIGPDPRRDPNNREYGVWSVRINIVPADE